MTPGHALGRAVLRWAQASRLPGRDLSIVGNSAAARELLRQILRVAKVNAPVLVCGESGSGKELTAQAIHRHSSRADGPFVAVNCGAIQATLVQSELFGHAKGAFTGAIQQDGGLIAGSSRPQTAARSSWTKLVISRLTSKSICYVSCKKKPSIGSVRPRVSMSTHE